MLGAFDADGRDLVLRCVRLGVPAGSGELLTGNAGSLKVVNTMPGWSRSLIRHDRTVWP